MPIIAKIENQEGLEHLEEIVQVADGIMIARGDLGVEIAIEELPVYQSYIAEICKKYGTPMIYATELLKHMVKHPFPTRAEVSDIYNAVMTGHDGLMLSDETAVGDYPVKSLEMLARIAERAEQEVVRLHEDFIVDKDDSYRRDKKYSSRSAHFLAEEVGAVGIIIFTNTGYFGKLTSTYGPNFPVYAFTPRHTTYQGLSLLYGIHPFLLKSEKDIEVNEYDALQHLKNKEYVKTGDKLIIAYDDIRDGKIVSQIKIVVV